MMPSFRQGFAWWSFCVDGGACRSLLTGAAAIGYRGVDFLPPEWWNAAGDLGLEVVTIDGHMPIEIGFNDRARHPDLLAQVRRAVETAAAAKIPFVAVASGNRLSHGGTDGLAACVDGLAPLAAEAHDAGVVLLLEPLNSLVDHPGHECDRTEWALGVIDQVNSPGLRVLYDFYHAQIMEGNLLQTVEKNLSKIAHFHTAGVPGRHELDDTQEINWRAVGRMLHSVRYTGYITHEFIPRAEPLVSLRQAFAVFASALEISAGVR